MQTRAVVNAGPLVALSLAGHLELLPLLFKEILIPRAVYREVAIDGLGRAGAASLSEAVWRARAVDARGTIARSRSLSACVRPPGTEPKR